MASAKMTTKGRITIPIEIRKILGLKAGSRLEFIDNGKGQYVIVSATIPVTALKGILERPNEAISITDMLTAIEKEYTS